MVKYGRLTPIAATGRRIRSNAEWEFLCDCGKQFFKIMAPVKGGHTNSCGCLHNDLLRLRSTTHGLSHLLEHKIWMSIIGRCSNKNSADFYLYGARGISICLEWRNDFMKFYKDMGPRPSPRHSIDRINVNDGYSQSNCRWATRNQQARNLRSTIRLPDGAPMYDLAESNGIPLLCAWRRVRYLGWDPIKAATTPVRA